MGEYWKPVNLTRKEYIHPHDVNDGLKLREWNHPETRTMRMMAEKWSDTDSVIFVSDYESLIIHRGALDGFPPTYDTLDEAGYERISRRRKASL